MTDALTTGVLSESWSTTDATYSPATFSGTLVEAWITQDEAISYYADVTGTLVEAWHTAPTGTTVAYTSGLLLEAWAAQATDANDQIVSGALVEVWLVIGVDPPPDPPPDPIFCATEPQDATGDPGSSGAGMTDMLGGALVPNNDPTDATGDTVTANDGVSLQLGTSISCLTSPTSFVLGEGSLLAFGAITGSPLAGDGLENSSAIGVTDQFGDAVICIQTPQDATGDIITDPASITFLFASETLSCVTSAENAAGDAGSTGAGITSQLDEAITPTVPPTDATGGTGPLPSEYTSQIP